MRQRRSTRKTHVYKRKSRKYNKTTTRNKRQVKRRNKRSIKRRNYRGGAPPHAQVRAPSYSTPIPAYKIEKERQEEMNTAPKMKFLPSSILPFLEEESYKKYKILLYLNEIHNDIGMVIFKIYYTDIINQKDIRKSELFSYMQNTLNTNSITNVTLNELLRDNPLLKIISKKFLDEKENIFDINFNLSRYAEY